MAPVIEFSWGFWILAALCLLLLPFSWIIAAGTAACFHETCHIFAVWLLGGELQKLSLRSGGAEIRISGLTPMRELLAAAAGPVGSLLLLTFLPEVPQLAVCGFLQGMFNLLPIYPLDGGRMLSCGLTILLGQDRGHAIAIRIGSGFCWFLAAAGIYCSLWGNRWPLPGLISLGILLKSQKIPCQKSFQALQ